MADIDLTPTEEMASNAARGLELREKHGKGGTAVGVARARDIKNRKNLSPDTVRRMHSFFSRHAGNEAGGEDDAGYISFLLWGGAAGRSWAKRKSAQLDKDENAMSDTRKAIMERLGMAAHPGAKAKFDTYTDMVNELRRATSGAIGVEWHTIANTWLSRKRASGNRELAAEANRAYDLVEREHLARGKRTASRLGAKAKMAGPTGRPIRGLQIPDGYFGVYERSNRPGQDAYSMWVTLTNGQSISLGSHPSLNGAMKIGQMLASGERKVKDYAFSRPGAKAKMANNGFAVTDAEYEALAANAANEKRLTGLGSMADYVITANDRAIRERAKAALAAAKARNDAWHKMWEQASTASAKAEVERRAEESERGMKRWKQSSRHGFSRPGAKAKMAQDWSGKRVTTESGKMFLVERGSNGYDLYALDTGKKAKSMTQQQMDEAARKGKFRDVFSSRPGAKAKFGADTQSVNGTAKRWVAILNRTKPQAGFEQFHARLKARLEQVIRDTNEMIRNPELQDQYGGWTFSDLNNIVRDVVGGGSSTLRYAQALLDSRFSRPGAKVRNAIREGEKVSASDDAVSRKIRKLMDEGKPQDQAVAIALDLERRGEL